MSDITSTRLNASITLTGSIAALTAALQAFEAAQGADHVTYPTQPAGNYLPKTPMASTNTAAGILPPMPLQSAPSGAVPIPTAPTPPMSPAVITTPATQYGEDDEDGDQTDGTGVDADGLPWDERIHASTKTKTAKGVWTKRRGGPSGNELAAIEAELRGEVQQPLPIPAPAPAPVAPLSPVPMPMPAPAPAPVAPPAMPDAPAPMPAAAPAPVAETEQWDFAKLMAQIGPKMGTTIDPAYLASVCQKYGIGAITDTATKPEMIGQLVAQFQSDGRW